MTSVLPNEQHNLIVHYRNQLFVRSRISCWTRRVVLFIKQKEKKKRNRLYFRFSSQRSKLLYASQKYDKTKYSRRMKRRNQNNSAKYTFIFSEDSKGKRK